MALSSTMFRFNLDVSDVERGVYAQDELRVAQHPSESSAYLLTRVIAYALEYDADLVMGRGIAFPDEPTLAKMCPTGRVLRWIEVGVPSADRLHRVAKSSDDVVLYAHKSLQPLLNEVRNRPVHRSEHLVVVTFSSQFLAGLVPLLSRQCALSVLRNEGVLYVSIGGETHETALVSHALATRIATAEGG